MQAVVFVSVEHWNPVTLEMQLRQECVCAKFFDFSSFERKVRRLHREMEAVRFSSLAEACT